MTSFTFEKALKNPKSYSEKGIYNLSLRNSSCALKSYRKLELIRDFFPNDQDLKKLISFNFEKKKTQKLKSCSENGKKKEMFLV